MFFLFVVGTKEKRYFYINDEEGNTYRIKKETFIRRLNENDFISKDRTYRFVEKRKKQNPEMGQINGLVERGTLAKGDWVCLEGFKGLAQILVFRNMAIKQITASAMGDFVQTNADHVGMLCNYYQINDDLSLSIVNYSDPRYFVPVKKYLKHIEPPTDEGDKLMIPNTLFDLLKSTINTIETNPANIFGDDFGTNNVPNKSPTKTKRKRRLSVNEDDIEYKPPAKKADKTETERKKIRVGSKERKSLPENNKPSTSTDSAGPTRRSSRRKQPNRPQYEELDYESN